MLPSKRLLKGQADAKPQLTKFGIDAILLRPPDGSTLLGTSSPLRPTPGKHCSVLHENPWQLRRQATDDILQLAQVAAQRCSEGSGRGRMSSAFGTTRPR
jgi:hypothetical protein